MSNAYLAMDGELRALNQLVHYLKQADANAEIRAFSRITDAQREIENGYRPIAAFLDVEMHSSITGIELARMIQVVSPETDIVFVTAHDQYALEAFALRASGFILKPATAELVRQELQCLIHHPPIGGGDSSLFYPMSDAYGFMPYHYKSIGGQPS